jgi:hypothetical protein
MKSPSGEHFQEKNVLGPVAAFLLMLQASAHAQDAAPPSDEAVKMEAALKQVPRDGLLRASLLDYYFRAHIDPAIAIAARRRHILWLIANAPDSEFAYGPLVSIYPSGHALADPEGFRLASEAWRAQAAKGDARPLTLANAAYYFKFEDKPYALSLLKRALALDPHSKEIAGRLADEYVLLILGVTMLNGAAYPARSDAALTQAPLATQAREELATCSNPYLLARAGYQLLWQGDVLYYSGKLQFDPQPLAKSTLERAVSLAPEDKDIAALRAEYDKFQLEKNGRSSERAPAPAPAPTPTFAPVPAPPPPADPGPAPPAAGSPPPPAITANDLRKITIGTTREDLLKIGPPASRISVNDDGHLIEIYQYSAHGARLGTVRLQDGAVSMVKVP